MKVEAITRQAVQVANSLLAIDGNYCEIVSPPTPGKNGTWSFVKRDPVTGKLYRVFLKQEELT